MNFENSAKLNDWESSLKKMREEYDGLLSRGLWTYGPSDTLSIINRTRHETYHSAMIAWLCDPRRPHGLADRFYRELFCSDVLVNPQDLTEAQFLSVTCEQQIMGTRADIVLEFSTCRIVIENKIDAGEQSGQCDRLIRHFRPTYFVFLTPQGYPPTTLSCKAHCILLSYRDIVNALNSATNSHYKIFNDFSTSEYRSTDQYPNTIDHTNILTPGRRTALNYLDLLRREFL